MPFPKRSDELRGLGWKYQSDSICKNCGQKVEWWTTPDEKWVPLLPMPKTSDPVITHYFHDCANT